ncbi:MAG: FtsX-like permease family protein, partial [Ginsengibacter sp.]
YRVVSDNKDVEGNRRKDGSTGYFQGPRFTQNVPGIEAFVRVKSGTRDMKTGADIYPQDLLYVDSNFFSVFSFPLKSGSLKTCLKDPHSVVISEEIAEKQFNTTDAVGKIIMLKDDSAFVPYQVSAVAKKTPQNSSIKFNMLLPFTIPPGEAVDNEDWFNFFLNTFVVLNPNAKMQQVESQMQKFYMQDSREGRKLMKEQFGDILGDTRYMLQPYIAMHMSTELPSQNGLGDASNPMYSYILSGIALFILLIACINFVNLTVARSVKRAKEIGIRKVVGGERKQLIFQFLGESFFLCIIAFLLAIAIVQITLPVFNDLANKALSLSYLFDVKLIVGYIFLFLVTGFLAGFYPALVLSGYKPVDTLYSRFNLTGKNYLQKSLVVLQFTLASFLIIATLVMYAQFNFLTTEKLGYDDSNLVIVNVDQAKHSKAALVRNELMKDKNIVDVAAKNGGVWGTAAKNANDSIIRFAYETVNESYIPLLKIPILQGRNFSKEFPNDSANSVIVNEEFVKEAGWKNPIGQVVNFWYRNEVYHVIGVVKNYHYASLNEKIGSQLFTMKNDNPYGAFGIKIKAGSDAASLKYIQATFKKFFPISPYSYVFKDQQNLKNYEAEAKWKQIMFFSAILTIFISCIGLFGLSVLSAEKRTKEVGIRKVLGASVKNVVTILSKDFVKLVIIALVIAVPLAWMAADKWLENYPYRITLSWPTFALAGFIVIFIAIATVSFQAIKAAIANPVKSLRTE